MKKLIALAILMASCQANHNLSQRQPKTVIVRYNDQVTDTLTTNLNYKVGKLEFVAECSCDALILSKR